MANTGSTTISPRDVRSALINENKFVHEEFLSSFNAFVEGTPMGDPTGTAGDTNGLQTDRNLFQYHIIGTATILAPKRTATGIDLSLDKANNDGLELTLGCEHPEGTVVSAKSRGTFTVGTDAPFYFAFKSSNADVSGNDEYMVGFRKSELYQAVIETAYDEMAAFNVVAGDINTFTILNSSGGTVTDTDTTDNWADAETKTLMVIVDSDGSLFGVAGAVYYEIDGVVPTTLASSKFKFDSGEVVIPFFAYRYDATTPGVIEGLLWESGHVGVGETTQLAGQVIG